MVNVAFPSARPKVSAEPDNNPALKKLIFNFGEITLDKMAIADASAISVPEKKMIDPS